MLSRAQVAEVEELLAEGRSQREAGRLSGVGRGSVGRIYRSEHPYSSRNYREPDTAADEPSDDEQPQPRCPDCGALVVPPCLACRIRRLLATASRPSGGGGESGSGGEDLTIELHGGAEARYQKLRLKKIQQGVIEVSLVEGGDDETPPTDEQLEAIEREEFAAWRRELNQDVWREPVMKDEG